MELRQLEYLVAVVDAANFTHAAERLHVAQPGVSTRIRQLERELGHALLDRSGRTVRVTEVGAAVLPYARAALAAVEGARQAADELAGLVRGRLALGAVASPVAVDLPRVLAGFRHRHPGVDIALAVGDPDDLAAGVRSGRLDAAFSGLGGEQPPGLAALVLADQAIVVATAHDDPLAGGRTVTLADLAERDLIAFPRGTGQRATVDAAFAGAGLAARVTLEASSPQVQARLAGFGLGVALLPASVAEAEREHVQVLELDGPPLRVRFGAWWRADGPASPAARALVAHLRREVAPTPVSPGHHAAFS